MDSVRARIKKKNGCIEMGKKMQLRLMSVSDHTSVRYENT